MSVAKARMRTNVIKFACCAIAVGAIVFAVIELQGQSADGRPNLAPAPGLGTAGTNVKGCVVGERRFQSSGAVGGSTLVVGCARTKMLGIVAIGAVKDHKQTCVEVRARRKNEVHAAVCRAPGLSWQEQWCLGAPSCVLGVPHGPGYSEVIGLLPANVAAVRVRAEGHPPEGSVAVAKVAGKLRAKVPTDESFGFFAAVLPGCVPSDQMEVELLDAQGRSIGSPAPWKGPPVGCG